MDKTHPEISVFTTMPNNGYLAMVFQDTGVAMSANCSKKDAYEGLLEVCSHFLLDCIDDERPDFSKFSGGKPTPEEEAQIEKYAELVASAHDTFCEALKSRLAIGSTTKQLEATGLPHIFLLRCSQQEWKFSPENLSEHLRMTAAMMKTQTTQMMSLIWIENPASSV